MITLGIGGFALVVLPDLRIGTAHKTNEAGDCIVWFLDGTCTYAQASVLNLSL